MTGKARPSNSPPVGLAERGRRQGKMRAPLLPEHHVRRDRLFELLDEVTAAPFTLVVAPAGAGKTSLLAGWTAEGTCEVAWLSLDQTDQDAGQFWSDFIAVVDTLVRGFGGAASIRLRALGGGVEIVDELLDERLLEERPPAFVVIDDLHLIDDVTVGAALALLVQHLPSWLHLIALSRREPDMPLDRLRARNQLGEVRFEELRFSPEESIELLSALAPSLTGESAAAVCDQADGWAASLLLAALAERSTR